MSASASAPQGRGVPSSAPRLVLRTVRADASATILVAVLTLLVAVVAGVIPRAMDQLVSSDLHYSAAQLSDPLRDAKGVLQIFPGGPDPGSPEDAQDELQRIYGRLDSALADWRSSQRQPLRGILQSPHYVVRMTDRAAAQPPVGAGAPGNLWLRAAADPEYLKHIQIVAGAAPKGPIPRAAADDAPDSGAADDPAAGADAPPLEMALSVATARAMHIAVGDVLPTDALGPVRISGLFEPTDPGGDYWSSTPSVTDVDVVDDGNRTPDYTGTGFIAPVALAPVADSGVELTTTIWYPIAADAVAPENARAVAAGIRGINQNVLSIPSGVAGITALVTMRSHLDEAIDSSLARVAATVALLSICVSGPIGVVIAVFALGVRAVVERRGAVIALASARGASPGQLRGTAAIEGLVVGLPAALLGAAIAALIVPGMGGAAAWAIPLVFGCVPAVLFAVLGGRRAFRTTRRDLSARARGGIRAAVAGAVIVLAGLAAYLLVRRGRVSTAGVDPLLALTPLLLALAASMIVLWVLPPALHAVAAIARRGRGVVGFVGSARALRDPALGVAAALAIVVGISVAVFSSVVLTSIDVGARARTESIVGADVRASGTIFTAAQQGGVAGIAGVAGVAPIADAGQLLLGPDAGSDSVEVLLADAASLHQQRSDVPANLGAKIDGRIPILISHDLSHDRRIGDDLTLGSAQARVVGILPADSGLGAAAPWVLADEAFAIDVGHPSFTPATLLVDVQPGRMPQAWPPPSAPPCRRPWSTMWRRSSPHYGRCRPPPACAQLCSARVRRRPAGGGRCVRGLGDGIRLTEYLDRHAAHHGHVRRSHARSCGLGDRARRRRRRRGGHCSRPRDAFPRHRHHRPVGLHGRHGDTAGDTGSGAARPGAAGLPRRHRHRHGRRGADRASRRTRDDRQDGSGMSAIVCRDLVRIFSAEGVEVQALQGLTLRGAARRADGDRRRIRIRQVDPAEHPVSGLDVPTAGAASVEGHDLLAMKERDRIEYRRHTVGFVWQQTGRNLHPLPFRRGEHLAHAGRRGRAAQGSRIACRGECSTCSTSGSCGDRLPSQLSGGQQQRVAIGVALANSPKVLLADEPTGELDEANSALVLETMRDVNERLGVTVLIVTHDAGVSGHVRRVVQIRDGRTSTETLRRTARLRYR